LRHFFKNFSYLTLADVGSRVFGFFATAYLARTLGVEKFGLLNLGFAFLSYGTLAMNPGIQLFATRAVTQQNVSLHVFVNDVLSLRFTLAVIAMFVFVCVSFVLFSYEVTFLVFLFSFSLFPVALLLEWYFQANEQIALIGISRTVSQATYLVLVLLFVTSAETISYAAIAWLVSSVVAALLLFIPYRRKHSSFIFRWNARSLFQKNGREKEILRNAFPIGFGTWLAQLGVHFPPLVIAYVLSEKEVGFFSAAYKIVFLFLLFDRVFFFLFYPVIIRTYRESAERLKRTLSLSLKIIITLLLPICFGVMFLSPKIIVFIYGSGYANAVPLLQILIWFVLFTVMHGVFTVGFIGIGKETLFSKIMLVGTIVQCALVVAGTVLFSTNGSALGFVAGEFCSMSLMMMQFRKIIRVEFFRFFLRPLAASAAMVAVLSVTNERLLWEQIMYGIIAFTVALTVVQGIKKEDIEAVKHSF
jgi:O-antigen/teichoic acid export membrane protein